MGMMAVAPTNSTEPPISSLVVVAPGAWRTRSRHTDHSDNTGFGGNTLKNSDYFGHSVALDGDNLMVGSPHDDGDSGGNTGAAYVFDRDSSTWSLKKELVDQPTGSLLSSSDYFGRASDIDGDYMVIGAPYDDTNGSNAGAVYVYKMTGLNWLLQQKLTESVAGDYFGHSVAIDGDTLAVGAYYDDGGSGDYHGAVYIFTRSGSAWSLQKEISKSSTVTGFTSATLNGNDYFGYSVALDGDTLAVGAYGDNSSRGATYVFTRSGSTWSTRR